MRITFLQKAEANSQYAEDLKGPEPGTPIKVREGGEATLVSMERVDPYTLKITVDLPERYDALITAPTDSISFR